MVHPLARCDHCCVRQRTDDGQAQAQRVTIFVADAEPASSTAGEAAMSRIYKQHAQVRLRTQRTHRPPTRTSYQFFHDGNPRHRSGCNRTT